MFTNLRPQFFRIPTKFLHSVSNPETSLQKKSNTEPFAIIDTTPSPDIGILGEKKSPLDPCTEDISHVAPYLKPTFNFAAYVNKSETLQELLKLGVDFHKLEKNKKFPVFIMRLDFEKDIKNHILFLHDRGMKGEDIASTITKNPYILQENLDDLQVRINYLQYKKFDDDMILRILHRNPFWLMFSTERIDTRLGYFQNTYDLTGPEVREVVCKQPRLITYSIQHLKLSQFALKEEMGFSDDEIKSVLLKKPKTFMRDKENLLKTYDYIVNTMNIDPKLMIEWPEVLTCREFRIKQRHSFLEMTGRAQYNPKLPNYISILGLVSGTDGDFAVNVAKSSLQAFNAFLKTL